MSENNRNVLGPNHQEWCKGELFRYSGEGYNRVKICACGAEDHAPEAENHGDVISTLDKPKPNPEKKETIHLVLRERYDCSNRLQESVVVKAFSCSRSCEKYLSDIQVEEFDGICYSAITMDVSQ